MIAVQFDKLSQSIQSFVRSSVSSAKAPKRLFLNSPTHYAHLCRADSLTHSIVSTPTSVCLCFPHAFRIRKGDALLWLTSDFIWEFRFGEKQRLSGSLKFRGRLSVSAQSDRFSCWPIGSVGVSCVLWRSVTRTYASGGESRYTRPAKEMHGFAQWSFLVCEMGNLLSKCNSIIGRRRNAGHAILRQLIAIY